MEYLLFPKHAVLCHGIGVANAPGQEGNTINHAWIELDGFAYDCVWHAKVPIKKYRADLKLSYVVEYTFSEVMDNWSKTDMPGPWDEKVLTAGAR